MKTKKTTTKQVSTKTTKAKATKPATETKSAKATTPAKADAKKLSQIEAAVAVLAKAGEAKSVRGEGIPVDEKYPECGKPLVIRTGRYGQFKACSGYPECKYKQSLTKPEATPLEEKSPTCGAQLVRRRGRYGLFVACSTYPACKYIQKKATEKVETRIACQGKRNGKGGIAFSSLYTFWSKPYSIGIRND